MTDEQIFEQAVIEAKKELQEEADRVADFTKSHTTVVVVENKKQLSLVLQWCEEQRKTIAPHMRIVNKFPYCLSVSTDTVGWTDQMDRALNYVPFLDFVKKVYVNN